MWIEDEGLHSELRGSRIDGFRGWVYEFRLWVRVQDGVQVSGFGWSADVSGDGEFRNQEFLHFGPRVLGLRV